MNCPDFIDMKEHEAQLVKVINDYLIPLTKTIGCHSEKKDVIKDLESIKGVDYVATKKMI